MTLRKITIDNSVRYIPKNEKMNKQKKKIINQKQQKLVHSLVNRIKIFHKTVKNSLKIFQHQDLNILQISICTSKQC